MAASNGWNNFRGQMAQGSVLGPAVVTSVTLTADNQFVNVQGFPLLLLYSNNTTAANRTFTLSPGNYQGHRLNIIFESGSSNTCQLANSGNVKLAAVWEPVQYQAIELYYDGTYWVEIGRTNPTVLSAALTSAHLFVGNASNIAVDVALSGDATLANTGAMTIANLAVTTAKINTAAVTAAKLASDVLVDLTGALTQAQIISLNTVPVVLLAASAAGTAYVIDEVEVFHSYSTTVYASGGDLTLTYGVAGDAILDFDASLVTAGTSFHGISRPTIYSLDASTGSAKSGYDLAGGTAKSLVLQAASADFTGGNAANVLKYRIRYHLVTVLT